jgi:hypothetical protein
VKTGYLADAFNPVRVIGSHLNFQQFLDLFWIFVTAKNRGLTKHEAFIVAEFCSPEFPCHRER